MFHLEASKLKWVNFILGMIGVNLLMPGGLHFFLQSYIQVNFSFDYKLFSMTYLYLELRLIILIFHLNEQIFLNISFKFMFKNVLEHIKIWKAMLFYWHQCFIRLLYFGMQTYQQVLFGCFDNIDIVKWRPPSLNELSLIIFNMYLTYLGDEASI